MLRSPHHAGAQGAVVLGAGAPVVVDLVWGMSSSRAKHSEVAGDRSIILATQWQRRVLQACSCWTIARSVGVGDNMLVRRVRVRN